MKTKRKKQITDVPRRGTKAFLDYLEEIEKGHLTTDEQADYENFLNEAKRDFQKATQTRKQV